MRVKVTSRHTAQFNHQDREHAPVERKDLVTVHMKAIDRKFGQVVLDRFEAADVEAFVENAEFEFPEPTPVQPAAGKPILATKSAEGSPAAKPLPASQQGTGGGAVSQAAK